MKLRVIIVLVCLSVSVYSKETPDPVGRYFSLGTHSERTLELKSDGTYIHTLKVQFRSDKIEKGKWKFENEIVTLDLDGEDSFGENVWYSKLYLRRKDGVKSLLCALEGDWAYDKYGFEESTNQAVDSMSATAPIESP